MDAEYEFKITNFESNGNETFHLIIDGSTIIDYQDRVFADIPPKNSSEIFLAKLESNFEVAKSYPEKPLDSTKVDGQN